MASDTHLARGATAGRHLVAEYRDCDPAVLNDIDAITSLMQRAAVAAGATVVSTAFHRFSPTGVSGVVVIQESHLSVHTWPEQSYAAIDFYTCGTCDPKLAHDVLAEGLGAGHGELVMLRRGVPGQRMNGWQATWRRAEPIDWQATELLSLPSARTP